MASADLATELMDKLQPNAYNEHLTALNIDTAMNNKIVLTLKTAFKGKYEFKSKVFRARNGTPKPTGMLELFAQYSGYEPNDIRKDMISYVRDTNNRISEICKDALAYKLMSFNTWVSKMSLKKSVCDEIALYALCKLYSRHAIIYTTKGYWTTLSESGLSGAEIEKECDLVLNYTEKGLVLCKKITEGNDADDEPPDGTPNNPRGKRKAFIVC